MDKINEVRKKRNYPVVAVVGAYHPGCRRGCVGFPPCCGVRGMSLPLAKTGVSGSEQDVCIPEFVATFPITPPPLPLDEHASVEGECRFVKGLLLDGPGKSVGSVLRSTGT